MGKIRRKKLIKQVQEDSAPYQLVHRHNENQSQELDALQLGQIESKSIVEENGQHLEEPKTLQENEQKQEISFEEPPTQKEESELTRGKVLQRQKIEYKKLREQIQKLSQEK